MNLVERIFYYGFGLFSSYILGWVVHPVFGVLFGLGLLTLVLTHD